MSIQDGRYYFRQCVPNGKIVVAATNGNAEQSRDWSFACNAPPEIQQQLDGGDFKAGNIIRGMDGKLYDGLGNFLASVPEWEMSITPDTSEYQAAGQALKWTLINGYTAELTFKETIIRDATILNSVFAAFASADSNMNVGDLAFMGVIKARATA